MNRQEYIEKLEGFGFPRSEYMILSGGSMLLRGLRETTADFDLCVSSKLAGDLDLEHFPKDDKGCYVPFEDVQMKAGLDSREFDIIDGYKCEPLESILAFKKTLMRPKDIKDIEVIENVLKLRDVRITVKRIACYKDLIEQYENPIEHTCDMRLGQVFTAKHGQRPQDFCDSAWDSVKPFVKELAEGGGNFYDGWMKDPKSAMISCNDGFRPVSFLLETV